MEWIGLRRACLFDSLCKWRVHGTQHVHVQHRLDGFDLQFANMHNVLWQWSVHCSKHVHMWLWLERGDL